MIHIFHGDNTEASRRELQLLKSKTKNTEIVEFDNKAATLTDIIQSTQSASFFEAQRLIVVENFLSATGRKSESLKPLHVALKQISKENSIVFWESKEISRSVLSDFPSDTDVALFKINRKIFNFLDKIKPQNSAEIIKSFHEAKSQENIEFIFAMLVRQIRLMIMVKDSTVVKLAPWQVKKMQTQCQNFTLSQLVSFYRQLLDIDVTIKSGWSAFDLTKSLEIILLSI